MLPWCLLRKHSSCPSSPPPANAKWAFNLAFLSASPLLWLKKDSTYLNLVPDFRSTVLLKRHAISFRIIQPESEICFTKAGKDSLAFISTCSTAQPTSNILTCYTILETTCSAPSSVPLLSLSSWHEILLSNSTVEWLKFILWMKIAKHFYIALMTNGNTTVSHGIFPCQLSGMFAKPLLSHSYRKQATLWELLWWKHKAAGEKKFPFSSSYGLQGPREPCRTSTG